MIKISRAVGAVILGYVLVAGGLSLIVMTWWINEQLPVSVPWVAAIVVGLAVLGWVAGKTARLVAGEFARTSALVLAALTTLVMTANIILNVAAEPLWFKTAVLVVTVPCIIIAGLRGGSSPAVRAAEGSGPQS